MKISNKPLFSIITPTYNRELLLTRLYKSLLLSECKDFEWIVVDDGSTDNTEQLINDFQVIEDVNVHYVKKNNGGKHTALNIGFSVCQGELLLILDSDDSIAPGTLTFVKKYWGKLKGNESCAGLIGLCADMNNMKKIIGDSFPFENDYSTITKNNFYYGLKGDKCDFIRTEYIKHLRFPVLKSQSFIPESIVTYELDRNYQYFCVNRILKYVEYQSEGITNNFLNLTLDNADGYFLRFKHLVDSAFLQQMSFKGKLVVLSNYFRYLHHSNNNIFDEVRNLPELGGTKFLLPFSWCIGTLYYLKDITLFERFNA